MAHEKDKSPLMAGIIVRGGSRNTFDCVRVAHSSGTVGAIIEDAQDSTFTNFDIIEIGKAFEELDKVEAYLMSVPLEDRERIAKPLNAIRTSNKTTFYRTYNDFVSSLADHATVITAMTPCLASLAAMHI